MALKSSQGIASSQLTSSMDPASQYEASSQSAKSARNYRPARPVPFELREHCIVYIEEELYSQAFLLLSNLLIAGSDATPDHEPPAFVPSSQILALAATLVVHPSMTNRATSSEQSVAADEALSLLRHVNALVGPAGADLATAFQFSAASSSLSRSTRRRTLTTNDDNLNADEDDGKINTSIAQQSALWNRANDFWDVVGWAFNCSVRHPSRWNRWKLFLDFMLDVLEADLDDKIQKAGQVKSRNDSAAVEDTVNASLLSQYLSTAGEGRTGKRRVMRAILADGSKKSMDEFGEIWKNETKEKSNQQDEFISKRKRLNFEEGELGDYDDADDDEDPDDDIDVFKQLRGSTRQSARKRVRHESPTPESEEEVAPLDEMTSSDYGGLESMLLRKRFMALLVKLCAADMDLFLHPDDLLDLYTEYLRPLPLSSFIQFVLPSSPYLGRHSQASLIQTLFRPLISSEAPRYKAQTMTQADFERHFLPFAANYSRYVENARVSLLVEGLLRLMLQHGQLEVTDSLLANLETGIHAREEKAKWGAQKKVGRREAEEELAVGKLDMSSARMRMLVNSLKDQGNV